MIILIRDEVESKAPFTGRTASPMPTRSNEELAMESQHIQYIYMYSHLATKMTKSFNLLRKMINLKLLKDTTPECMISVGIGVRCPPAKAPKKAGGKVEFLKDGTPPSLRGHTQKRHLTTDSQRPSC